MMVVAALLCTRDGRTFAAHSVHQHPGVQQQPGVHHSQRACLQHVLQEQRCTRLLQTRRSHCIAVHVIRRNGHKGDRLPHHSVTRPRHRCKRSQQLRQCHLTGFIASSSSHSQGLCVLCAARFGQTRTQTHSLNLRAPTALPSNVHMPVRRARAYLATLRLAS